MIEFILVLYKDFISINGLRFTFDLYLLKSSWVSDGVDYFYRLKSNKTNVNNVMNWSLVLHWLVKKAINGHYKIIILITEILFI